MHFNLFALSALVLSAVLVCQAEAAKSTVHINNKDDYCLILPAKRQTVGASEDGTSNGAKAFCTRPTGNQGSIPASFFKSAHIKTTSSYKQITGCIDPSKAKTVIPSDGGGQYDSNGGDGGHGNPPGSACAGYKSYVQLLEPAANRACLRCCNNARDCDLSHDTSGCPTVIPNGNYNGCSN